MATGLLQAHVAIAEFEKRMKAMASKSGIEDEILRSLRRIIRAVDLHSRGLLPPN